MRSFSKFHPATNFFYYISLIIISSLSLYPLMLLFGLLLPFFYSLKLQGKSSVKFFFCFIFPVIFISAVLNCLFAEYGDTLLFLIFGNEICLEPLIYGIASGTAAGGMIIVFFNLNHDIKSEKIMFAIAKAFPKTAVIITMSMSFIPEYKRRLQNILEAQKSFKNGGDASNFLQKIKFSGKIVTALFAVSAENSISSAISMKAKGYGLPNRTHFFDFKFRVRDMLICCIIACTDIIIFTGIYSGCINAVYNPKIAVAPFKATSAAVLAAYVILLLIPLILEISEELKWKKLLK